MSESFDPMQPRSNVSDALAGPLLGITLSTNDLALSREFYCDLMQLRSQRSTGRERVQDISQQRLWAIGPDVGWHEDVLGRDNTASVPFLRLVQFEVDGGSVRAPGDTVADGGLSVGFAMRDLRGLVAKAESRGFGTTAGVASLDFKRQDGSDYQALEAHFIAPDSVLALGVERPPDLTPVAPMGSGSSVGGPAYSAQVANDADKTVDFYTSVLGFEVRRDMEVSGPGPERGLNLPSGTSMRFMQVFAPASTSGYLVFLDFGEAGRSNDVSAPPARGVASWTLPVSDIDEAHRRAAAHEFSTVVSPPVDLFLPDGHRSRAMSVRTANGFLVELVEAETPDPAEVS